MDGRRAADRQRGRKEEEQVRDGRTVWSFTQSFAGHLPLSNQPDVTGAGHVELPGGFVHERSFVFTANTQTHSR